MRGAPTATFLQWMTAFALIAMVAGCESETSGVLGSESASPDLSTLEAALSGYEEPACCSPATTTGCVEPTCESCVCKADPFCCENAWDLYCIALGGGQCEDECGCIDRCTDPPGDTNLSGAADVLDVQCILLGALLELSGNGLLPGCAGSDGAFLDQNCDATVDVSDVLLSINYTLGVPPPEEIDQDLDGCVDACAFQVDNPCDQGEDGILCDDGNRCTAIDTCQSGTCIGELPTNCDDANPCTFDMCNIALGCLSFPNDLACELPFASGYCGGESCQIAACEPGHHDLNGKHADGCEYACTPAGLGNELCNNSNDDDCDGAVDEGCNTECLPFELPDDGFDQDCDGTELIGGSNALTYIGFLDPAGGPVSVGLAGAFDMAGFGSVPVDGTLTRAAQGDPISWCVLGEVPEADFSPMRFEKPLLTVCQSTTFELEASFSEALIEWEGLTLEVGGSFQLVDPETITAALPDATLTPGIRLVDASLAFEPESSIGTLTGMVELSQGNASVTLNVEGEYTAEGDLELALTWPESATPWTPWPALPVSLYNVNGSLLRENGKWDVEIEADVPLFTTGTLTMTDVLVQANSPGTEPWTLLVSGITSLGPWIDLTVAGELTAPPGAPLEGCLTGTGNATTHGVAFTGTDLTTCLVDGAPDKATVSGFMLLEGKTLVHGGSLVLGPPWSLTAILPHFPLGPGIVLDAVYLEFDPTLPILDITGEVLLGQEEEQAVLEYSGQFTPGADFALPLTLAPGTTWKPFEHLTLALDSATGTLTRDNGTTSLSVTGDYASDFPVAPSMVLTEVSVTGEINGGGQTSIILEGSANLGPFGSIAISGTIDQTTDICFEATKDIDLGLIQLVATTVSACVDPNGNITTTTSGLMNLEDTLHPFSGAADLESPWALQFDLETLDMGPGLVTGPVTLTLGEGASALGFNASLEFGQGASLLQLSAIGDMIPGNDYQIDLALTSDTAWDPFPGMGLMVTEVSGSLYRDTGVPGLIVTSVNPLSLPLSDTLTLSEVHIIGETTGSGAFIVELVGAVPLGPMGTVELTGVTAEGGEIPTLGECFSTSAGIALGSILFNEALVQVCFGETELVVSGDAEIEGTTQFLFGTMYLDPFQATLPVGDLPLGEGVTLDDAILVYTQGDPFLEVVATSTLGPDPTSVQVQVTGDYKNNGNAYLTVSQVPGTSWLPASALDVMIEGATGTIDRINDVLDVSVLGISEVPTPVAPGFTLNWTEAEGIFENGEPWKVALEVETELTLASDSLLVELDAVAQGPEMPVFTGLHEGQVQPLSSALGQDKVILQDIDLTVTPTAGIGIAIDYYALLKICFDTSACTLSEYEVVVAVGTGDGDETSFAATVPSDSLPHFGDLANLEIVGTSTPLASWDLWKTPDDPTDDPPIGVGVTGAAMAINPIPVLANEVPLPFLFHLLNWKTIEYSAPYNVDWSLFGPGDVPTITSVGLSDITVAGTLKKKKLTSSVQGLAVLVPQNQAGILTGETTIEALDGGGFGASIVLGGRWDAPFGLQGFAMDTPELLISMQLLEGAPIPESIGFTTSLYRPLPGEVLPEGPLAGLPDIREFNGTLHYQLSPELPELCNESNNVCAPLSPLLVDLNWTEADPSAWSDLDEAIEACNDLRTAIAGAYGYGDHVPLFDLTPPSLTPVEAALSGITVRFASSHEDLLGSTWHPGLHLGFDADLGGAPTAFLGKLTPDEDFVMHGIGSPGNVGSATLTGDPFRREAIIQGPSHLFIPNTPGLTPNQLTVETWLRAEAWSEEPGTSLIFDAVENGNGFRVGAGEPDELGNGTVQVELWTAGVQQVVATVRPALATGIRQHLAITLDGSAASIWVNGLEEEVNATGPSVAAGPLTGSLKVGEGVDRIDEVRIWSGIRTGADILASIHLLEADPEGAVLLSNHGFDAPQESAINDGGAGGTGWNGALIGGQVGEILDEGLTVTHRLGMSFNASIPAIATPALHFEAGMYWALPLPGLTDPFHVKSSIGDLEGADLTDAYATVFADTPVPLLTLTGLGTLGLSGAGQNEIAGDDDDGFTATGYLVEQALSGDAQLLFESNAEEESAGTGTLSYAPGSPLTWTGSTTIQAQLTQGQGTLTVDGSASWSSEDGLLKVAGAIDALGVAVPANDIVMGPSAATFTGPLDLTTTAGFPVVAESVELTLTYDPPELCGEGITDVTLPQLPSITFEDTAVLGCLGANPLVQLEGSTPALTLGGYLLEDVTMTFDAEGGVTLQGATNFPGVFSGYLSGPFAGADDFTLSAVTTVTVANSTIYNANLTFAPSGLTVDGQLDLGEVGSLPVSGTIAPNGAIAVTGNGDVSIDGLVLDMAVTATEQGIQLDTLLNAGPYNLPLSTAFNAPGNFLFQETTSLTFTGPLGLWSLPAVAVEIGACGDFTGPCENIGSVPWESAQATTTVSIAGQQQTLTSTLGDSPGVFAASIPFTLGGFTLQPLAFNLSEGTGMTATGTLYTPAATHLLTGGVPPDGGSYVLESGNDAVIDDDPAITGLVQMTISDEDATVTGTGALAFQGAPVEELTWILDANLHLTFGGTQERTALLGEICEPNPDDKVCETCVDVICTQECVGAGGSYCCPGAFEEIEFECNCVLNDYCEDLGTLTCQLTVDGTEEGVSNPLDAVCTGTQFDAFTVEVSSFFGEVCVVGTGPIGTQCVNLW